MVHRCVRLIAEAAAQTPLIAKVGGREQAEHPALALIERPNPRQGGIAFRETLYGHLAVAGNAYVEAVSIGREPRELHALRPDRMRVVPGRDGWAEAYDYSVGARTIRFRQDEGSVPPILHLTQFHPGSTLRTRTTSLWSRRCCPRPMSSSRTSRPEWRSAIRDVQAIEEHATFLSNKLQFMLNATLGLVSIEQNKIIKLFSVVAVVFMPPTLVASIYGMNFEKMPE